MAGGKTPILLEATATQDGAPQVEHGATKNHTQSSLGIRGGRLGVMQSFSQYYSKEMSLHGTSVPTQFSHLCPWVVDHKRVVDHAFYGAVLGWLGFATREGATKLLGKTLAGRIPREFLIHLTMAGVNLWMESTQKKWGLEGTVVSSKEAKTIEDIAVCQAGMIAAVQSSTRGFSRLSRAALGAGITSAASTVKEVVAQNKSAQDARAQVKQDESSTFNRPVVPMLMLSLVRIMATLPLAISTQGWPVPIIWNVAGHAAHAKICKMSNNAAKASTHHENRATHLSSPLNDRIAA